MKPLNTKEMKNISGALSLTSQWISVSDESCVIAPNGYTYYPHHMIDPAGNIIMHDFGTTNSFTSYINPRTEITHYASQNKTVYSQLNAVVFDNSDTSFYGFGMA